jgi:ankyrin repeat protein
MRCLLREFGADINHSSDHGNTALMTAARFKHAALTKWLVKAGANPQAEDSKHRTAADVSRIVGAPPS